MLESGPPPAGAGQKREKGQMTPQWQAHRAATSDLQLLVLCGQRNPDLFHWSEASRNTVATWLPSLPPTQTRGASRPRVTEFPGQVWTQQGELGSRIRDCRPTSCQLLPVLDFLLCL